MTEVQTSFGHANERLNNRRNDETHKISRELADSSLLAFEDLDIQRMIDKTEIMTYRGHSTAWHEEGS